MMAAPDRYTIMVGEDEEIERRAIQWLIERQIPRIRLAGAAATGTELVVRMHALRPHILILDSHLPGSSLMTTLNLLLSQQPDLKVILLADFDEGSLMGQCVRFGAFAYLTRLVQPLGRRRWLLSSSRSRSIPRSLTFLGQQPWLWLRKRGGK